MATGMSWSFEDPITRRVDLVGTLSMALRTLFAHLWVTPDSGDPLLWDLVGLWEYHSTTLGSYPSCGPPWVDVPADDISAGDDSMRTSQLNVGTSTDVSLKIAETDLSLLAATIRAPSGNEEPCLLKRLPNRHIGVQGHGDTTGTQGHADVGTGELAHGHMRGGCGTWGLVGTEQWGCVVIGTGGLVALGL